MSEQPVFDLSKHEPYWVQSRDEPVGQWNCPCGHTFAPDDLDQYQKHLVEDQQRVLAAYRDAAKAVR